MIEKIATATFVKVITLYLMHIYQIDYDFSDFIIVASH